MPAVRTSGERCRFRDRPCPSCGSLERHRLANVLLAGRLGRVGSTLHVAPEPVIEGWLRSISGEYLSIDLMAPNAMRRMDLTALELPDGSIDLIWCSHVLEHIPDDAAAMREMARVLRPGGTAVVQVPIRGQTTYEDPSITTPEGRLEHFLQEDHVRLYGTDIADRLRAAGLEVEVLDAADLPPDRVRRHSLAGRQVFAARKPGGA